MRDGFRRVKDRFSRKRKDSVVDSLRSDSTGSTAIAQASFLGLPPELRNNIYHHLADATTLLLSPAGHPKRRPPPVGLLAACKQTLKEYKAILMTRACIILAVHDYNFSNVIRTFEKLNDDSIALMKLNEQIWIYLHLGHVPSRDDRKALRAWCDYRKDMALRPYFGSGQRVSPDVSFHYDVQFLHHMRPPRPPIRYANGIEMRRDLLRSHQRMAAHIESLDEESPSMELRRIRDDLEDRAKILDEMLVDAGATLSIRRSVF
ncbi:hypothetical protein BDY17DRAFT_289080 [Neohortaea acidophila]|uniref:F-box domain-containing protein n=1 Tax=Neohortaea acidophila TaxID=245834 RepID=A0A6A6Q686_9PEZI|nr:uncharacterized protein BDY17DRAFT_289080 [Neohortaea acidophila]KAF2487494.1 hypothetical protein BDY17DRAFT_289080 [Neohortaea acidophila]